MINQPVGDPGFHGDIGNPRFMEPLLPKNLQGRVKDNCLLFRSKLTVIFFHDSDPSRI
jgi:hypothetical protein